MLPNPTGGSNPIDLLDFGTSSESVIVLENVRFDQIGDFSIEFVDPVEFDGPIAAEL